MATSSNENFLTRWSRLKREPGEEFESAAQSGESGTTPDQPSNKRDRAAAGVTSHPEAEPRLGAGMETEHESAPQAGDCERSSRDFSDFDFDKLDYESDYTQFLKDDVPADARKQALRKLWLSNPVLANMDGLDDYCEDYTDAAMVPVGGIKTAYRVGRGFLNDQEVAEWEELGRPVDLEAVDTENGEQAPEGHEVAAMKAEGPNDEDGTALADELQAQSTAGAAADEGAGGMGAACAAVVKREEAEALTEYEAGLQNEATERASKNQASDGAWGVDVKNAGVDDDAGKGGAET